MTIFQIQKLKEKSLSKENKEEKQTYSKPVLKEHGNVEDITLQGFFGSFSPPAKP